MMTDEKDNAEPSGASGGSLANAHSARQDAEAKIIVDGIAEIMRIASEPDWIPVTERLPEEYEHVLGWNRGWCRAAEVWRNTGGEWRGGDYESIGRITHWMPLPAPPTDDK